MCFPQISMNQFKTDIVSCVQVLRLELLRLLILRFEHET